MDASQTEPQADIALHESRADFYRMLYKLYFFSLTDEEVDALDPQEFLELSLEAAEMDNPLMAEGYDDIYRYLRRKNTGTRQALSADLTRTFLGNTTYHGLNAMPVASLYTGPESSLMGKERTAVRRIFREHGVKLEDGIDLPEDHLAFECEFMAVLCDRIVEGLKAGDAGRVHDLLETQADFLENHMLTWLDRFYLLAGRIAKTRFYCGLLKVTKGFLEEDVGLTAYLVDELEQAG